MYPKIEMSNNFVISSNIRKYDKIYSDNSFIS